MRTNKKIAGAMLVMVPMVFFMLLYVRYDCAAGRCSIGMNWLITGFFVMMFGLFLLLTRGSDDDEPEPPKKKNAKQKKTV